MTLPATVTSYLDAIGASPTVKARLQIIVHAIENILSSEGAVKRIFLNTYVDESGNSNYDNAWIFTEDKALEVTNFLLSDPFRFDAIILNRSVWRWEVTFEKYDFAQDPTPASRMLVHINFAGIATGTMRSSGVNCKYLYELLKEVVNPNLAPGLGSSAMAPL